MEPCCSSWGLAMALDAGTVSLSNPFLWYRERLGALQIHFRCQDSGSCPRRVLDDICNLSKLFTQHPLIDKGSLLPWAEPFALKGAATELRLKPALFAGRNPPVVNLAMDLFEEPAEDQQVVAFSAAYMMRLQPVQGIDLSIHRLLGAAALSEFLDDQIILGFPFEFHFRLLSQWLSPLEGRALEGG